MTRTLASGLAFYPAILADLINREIPVWNVNGTINETSAHPADILGVLACLREIHGKKYTSLIFSHNHPSGDPSPSRADQNMTRRR